MRAEPFRCNPYSSPTCISTGCVPALRATDCRTEPPTCLRQCLCCLYESLVPVVQASRCRRSSTGRPESWTLCHPQHRHAASFGSAGVCALGCRHQHTCCGCLLVAVKQQLCFWQGAVVLTCRAPIRRQHCSRSRRSRRGQGVAAAPPAAVPAPRTMPEAGCSDDVSSSGRPRQPAGSRAGNTSPPCSGCSVRCSLNARPGLHGNPAACTGASLNSCAAEPARRQELRGRRH